MRSSSFICIVSSNNRVPRQILRKLGLFCFFCDVSGTHRYSNDIHSNHYCLAVRGTFTAVVMVFLFVARTGLPIMSTSELKAVDSTQKRVNVREIAPNLQFLCKCRSGICWVHRRCYQSITTHVLFSAAAQHETEYLPWVLCAEGCDDFKFEHRLYLNTLFLISM
jgi:hypothetical protein